MSPISPKISQISSRTILQLSTRRTSEVASRFLTLITITCSLGKAFAAEERNKSDTGDFTAILCVVGLVLFFWIQALAKKD